LQKLLAAADIDRQRFHDLRHDAASLMHANRDDLRTIMANLGHSTIATIANFDTHVTQATQRRSAERMGELLARRAQHWIATPVATSDNQLPFRSGPEGRFCSCREGDSNPHALAGSGF
jgi:hypothetical protein